MLIKIGPRSQPVDLVGMLLECHERIRSFTRLALSVGQRADVTDAEVVDACQRCERYFIEALPLHVADEEDSILPRLRGEGDALDAALDAMSAEHAEHRPLLEALLASTARLRLAPRDADVREEVRAAASRLFEEFERHLRLEEEAIFPRVRAGLTEEAQEQVIVEMRQRRGGR